MSTSPDAFGTETDLRRDLGLGTATAMVRDRDWLGYFHRPRSRSRPCRLSFRGYCGVARFRALRALRDLFETEEGFERVDEVVAWCEKHEVYVILDAHAVFGWQNTDWSSDNATGRALFWKERHYQDRYVGWWEQLAER